MMRIVVLGTGLDGLLAGWVLRQHPHLRVRIVGTAPIGSTTDAADQMLSTTHTISMGNLLRALEIDHSSFTPRDGIMLQGQVHRYPHHLRHLSQEGMLRVRHDCLIKARRILPSAFPQKFATPLRPKERRLRCMLDELVDALTRGADVRRVPEWQATANAVDTPFGRLDFDHLVVTAPLWECRDRLPFAMPPVLAVKRTTAYVVPRDTHVFARWDSVLTPYTPENAIHRVYSSGGRYVAEATGHVQPSALLGDLNFIFEAGYQIDEVRSGMPGDPAIGNPVAQWPENMTALGASATWNPSAKLDATLDGAYDLMRRLGGGQKPNGRHVRNNHLKVQATVSTLPVTGRRNGAAADDLSAYPRRAARRQVSEDSGVRNVRRKILTLADDQSVQSGAGPIQGPHDDPIQADGPSQNVRQLQVARLEREDV